MQRIINDIVNKYCHLFVFENLHYFYYSYKFANYYFYVISNFCVSFFGVVHFFWNAVYMRFKHLNQLYIRHCLVKMGIHRTIYAISCSLGSIYINTAATNNTKFYLYLQYVPTLFASRNWALFVVPTYSSQTRFMRKRTLINST